MRKNILIGKVLPIVLSIVLMAFALSSCGLFSVEVTFDTDGGREIEAITVGIGDNIPMPEDPVKEGYLFVGWVTADGAEWSFDEMQAREDMTLKAVWQCTHQYDHACDNECNTEGCDFIRETEHIFSHACDGGCNTPGCGVTRATEHSFDHACDPDCNVEGCGYERQIAHDFTHGCDTECNVEGCGFTREADEEHLDENSDGFCDKCESEIVADEENE